MAMLFSFLSCGHRFYAYPGNRIKRSDMRNGEASPVIAWGSKVQRDYDTALIKYAHNVRERVGE